MENVTWVLDTAHSELQFKVKHMMISTITGTFAKIEATLLTEGDELNSGKVQFSADSDSISTNNEQRDGHLKSPEFFNVENHPKVTFNEGTLAKVSDDQYKLTGNLSMLGVTHPVSLDVEYGGTVLDPWGNTRSGFTLNGKVNRKDFGLVWNANLDQGGVALGEEVKILGNLEFVKAK